MERNFLNNKKSEACWNSDVFVLIRITQISTYSKLSSLGTKFSTKLGLCLYLNMQTQLRPRNRRKYNFNKSPLQSIAAATQNDSIVPIRGRKLDTPEWKRQKKAACVLKKPEPFIPNTSFENRINFGLFGESLSKLWQAFANCKHYLDT